MSITINHNAMAANAYRNLSNTYGKLSTSVQRMSSGLRINSAADDAAGLAIREMMRADIATLQQGLRNAADGISMIQTADGGLAVIDEKLTRMKELAEQASTGTYTTVQREIINSEYQAMAAEIDRIANSTNFNGIKLLDGSVSNQHGGLGIKIHFGASNSAAEDYYFVNIGDARATSSTGLRVGGDAKNDIWGQGAAGSGPLAGPGCCTAGFSSLNGNAGFTSGETFSFGYNWDWKEDEDADLLSGKYLAGRYTVNSSDSLQDLINKVNAGTQARVGIAINGADLATQVQTCGGTVAVCVGDEAYYWGSASVVSGYTQTVYDAKLSSGAVKVGYQNNAAGTTTYFASGSVQDALKDAGINLANSLPTTYSSAGFMSSASAVAAGVAGYTSAVSAAVAGWQANPVELSISASGAAAAVTGASMISANVATAVSAAGIGSTSGELFTANGDAISGTGSFSLGTGIYTDGNGNWTASATIGTDLGWNEIIANYHTTSAGNLATDKSATVSLTLNGATIGGSSALSGAGANATTMAQAAEDLITSFMDDTQAANTGTVVQITGAANTNAGADITAAAGNATFDTTDREETVGGIVDKSKSKIQVADNAGSGLGYSASALARAINENADSQFWAMTETVNGQDMVYVFAKEGGTDQNSILACEVAGRDSASREALNAISFENVETGDFHNSGTNMSLGGQKWGTLSPVQTKSNKGHEVWNLTLNGRDVGAERDLWIANDGELTTPGLDQGIINGMDRDAFVEIQNASNANWKGAEVRTQSAAQEALDALTEAIVKKDKIRADLGALQNRLENTMTNQEIQIENLQASESRISDVDVAKEMTEFTKNNVMTQAATSMLAQANSMSQLALSLIG